MNKNPHVDDPGCTDTDSEILYSHFGYVSLLVEPGGSFFFDQVINPYMWSHLRPSDCSLVLQDTCDGYVGEG